MMFKWYKLETLLVGGDLTYEVVPPRGELRREVLPYVQPLESLISSLTVYSVSRGLGINSSQYLLSNCFPTRTLIVSRRVVRTKSSNSPKMELS